MKFNQGFEKIGDLFSANQNLRQTNKDKGGRQIVKATKKTPAYAWQDLALRVIKELNIPNFKRSSVFKACKENTRPFIEECLNDTKELCRTGVKWKYFFKLVNQ